MGGTRIVATGSTPQSLVWLGDLLVDPVGLCRSWDVDGVGRDGHMGFGGLFDRAAASPSGGHVVLYAERGTKAIVVDMRASFPRVVRELDRSFYQAETSDYPVAVGRLRDGREVVAHCPDRYAVVEIEELESGRRLTEGPRDGDQDIFHSRLEFSPGGRHLLSVGWLWGPAGVARVFDAERALVEPSILDGGGEVDALSPIADTEITAGCLLDDDRVVLATGVENFGDSGSEPAVGARELATWSLSRGTWLGHARVDHPVGATLMAYGDAVLTFAGHPRLVSVGTGDVLAEWPEVAVDAKDTVFGATHVPSPVVALHREHGILAVAQECSLALIDLPALPTDPP